MSLRVRDGRCKCAGLHGGANECDLAVGVRALAAPYALDILDHLSQHGLRRFSELQHALDLAPNTLARRLDELAAAGVLAGGAEGYALTPAGARLWQGAQAIAAWRA